MRMIGARLATLAFALAVAGCTTTTGSGTTGADKSPGGSDGAGAGGPGAPSGSATPIALAAGTGHTCALRGNGAVACWGANEGGQLGDGTVDDRSRPVTVKGLGDAVEVALGSAHSCARRSNGVVVCWGDNTKGQLGSGMDTASRKPTAVRGLADASEIASGDDHVCALRDSAAVVCWGANADGQLGNRTRSTWNEPAQIRGLADATSLAAGARHSCALRKNGGVICWGANDKGQLGDGGTKGHERPSAVGGLPAVTGLAAAGARTCGWNAQALFCWGDDGDGRTTTRPVKIDQAPADDPIASVELGPQHACLRRKSGLTRCWGQNGDGRVGDGSFSTRARPVQVAKLGASRDIAVGGAHTCALRSDGTVLCWGDDASGALGQGDDQAGSAAVGDGVRRVRKLTNAVDLASGDGFSCAVEKAGRVLCWGRNDVGQLGDGTTEPERPGATPVYGVTDAIAVAAGPAQACAVRQTGGIVCWGDNDGRLGRPKGQALRRPAGVPKIDQAVDVTLGRGHGCALLQSGGVNCWGDDANGQLGDGAGSRGGVVSGLGDAIAIDAGLEHTCALRRTGSVACWGANLFGQIGNSVGAAQLKQPIHIPTLVTKLGDAVEIAMGPEHGCARKRDGKAVCWGHNDKGQLGSGTQSSVWTSRVPVRDLAGLAALDVGPVHACGASKSRVSCWGDNGSGQGGFASPSATTPQPGVTQADVVSLALGRDHSCARLRNGDVACWGSNDRGQLGDGGRMTSPFPLEVQF